MTAAVKASRIAGRNGAAGGEMSTRNIVVERYERKREVEREKAKSIRASLCECVCVCVCSVVPGRTQNAPVHAKPEDRTLGMAMAAKV